MCTTVNQEDLLTVFRKMGHIHYYMQYKNQPLGYRQAANQGEIGVNSNEIGTKAVEKSSYL